MVKKSGIIKNSIFFHNRCYIKNELFLIEEKN
jgi:hypothetical protein